MEGKSSNKYNNNDFKEKYNSQIEKYYYDENTTSNIKTSKDTKNEIKDVDEYFLNEEYEKYKKYLLLRNECPVCHFFQGMIFTGIGFFCFTRAFHFRLTYTKKDIVKMLSIGLPFSLLGIYKFTYVNYIIQMKKRMIELNQIKEVDY
jgi:hypothetical protein